MRLSSLFRASLFFFVVALLLAASPATQPSTQPATLAGESHQIENIGQSQLLRPRDARSQDGTPLVMYPHEDWKCMTWKIEPVGDDVRLLNYFTHKTLYPAVANSAVAQYPAAKVAADAPAAEHWRFLPVGGGVYRIEHVATGQTLSVNADGNVIVEPWTGSDSQKWKLLERPAKFTG